MTACRDGRSGAGQATALVLAVAAAAGCAALQPTTEYARLAKANAAAQQQLVYGMSRAEARDHMGAAQVKPPWSNSRGIGPATVANPLDSVKFEAASGDDYEVDRYVVGLNGDPRCPFVRGHARLIPLIYYDGTLVAWEWRYLEDVLGRRLTPEEQAFSFGQFCSAEEPQAGGE